MWIENEKGTVCNCDKINYFYIATSIIIEDNYCLCANTDKEPLALYQNITKERAEKIYENLKLLLKVNANFLSKEQLLEN